MGVIAVLTRVLRSLGDLVRPGYRPEQHYMRGPGPAYLKRHGGDFRLGS